MMTDEQQRGGVSAPPRKILILGVGNLLLKDDGFGVHLINALKDTSFPEHITLLEAGTVSHQLIPLLPGDSTTLSWSMSWKQGMCRVRCSGFRLTI